MDADTQLREPVTTQKREDGGITMFPDTSKTKLKEKKKSS